MFCEVPGTSARKSRIQNLAPCYDGNHFRGMRASLFARIDERAAAIFGKLENCARLAGRRAAIFGGTFQMEERFVLRGGVASASQNENQSHPDNFMRRGVRDFVFVGTQDEKNW